MRLTAAASDKADHLHEGHQDEDDTMAVGMLHELSAVELGDEAHR